MANALLSGCISRTVPSDSCQRASDLCKTVLATAVKAVEPFFMDGPNCGGVAGLVTHTTPAVDDTNFVAVWIESFTPLGTPTAAGAGMRVGLPGVLTVSIGIQFWVYAYPQPYSDGKEIFTPSLAEEHEAALVLATIGETWYQSMVGLLSSDPGSACQSWSLETCVPLQPQSGSVGWETGLTAIL